MKCPYAETHIECENIDTAGMEQSASCTGCNHYPDPLAKLMNTYPVEQMLDFLPPVIIKEKKSFFRADEIFDLEIKKDGMGNWVIEYFNERSFRTLFVTRDQSIHKASATMLADLIGNGYIKELKKDIVIWNVNKTPDKFELNTK
jgi:hypothetical protein